MLNWKKYDQKQTPTFINSKSIKYKCDGTYAAITSLPGDTAENNKKGPILWAYTTFTLIFDNLPVFAEKTSEKTDIFKIYTQAL